MYIAQVRAKQQTHFFIRESYCTEENIFKSRDLFYLGTNPAGYIVYPGGNAYYFDEAIEDRLRELHVKFDDNSLDDIFWPFVKPDIQNAHAYFRNRSSKYKNKTALTPSDRFHLFDRRRIHFLRYGQMDQGRIGRASPKLFQLLNDKSRDEIEQYFISSEQILRPRELKSYIFVIFDLQRHFSEHFAKTMPQGLDQSAVDQSFVRDICQLNRDERFWQGLANGSSQLHDYLVRYLIMFFDYDYGRSNYLDDILQSWMNSRRHFQWPARKKTVSMKEAGTIFGVPETQLRTMTRRELSSLFRKKAQEHHPDKGGDQEKFVALVEAYQSLKERKKKG